jgi:hypothetical protein
LASVRYQPRPAKGDDWVVLASRTRKRSGAPGATQVPGRKDGWAPDNGCSSIFQKNPTALPGPTQPPLPGALTREPLAAVRPSPGRPSARPRPRPTTTTTTHSRDEGLLRLSLLPRHPLLDGLQVPPPEIPLLVSSLLVLVPLRPRPFDALLRGLRTHTATGRYGPRMAPASGSWPDCWGRYELEKCPGNEVS